MNEGFFPLPRILSPAKSIVCALIFGPLVLSIFYFYSIMYNLLGAGERGLFQFYSATVGDFLILPIAWYFMSRYYQKIRLANMERDRVPSTLLLAYFIGILSTIFVTLAGVYGPNRDWTLPQFGQINAAGIYHSIFMAFMLGTFWDFHFDYWGIVLRKVRRKNIDGPLLEISVQYWIIMNLLTLFLVLLWADNIYSLEKTQFAFFVSNKFQQIGWWLFLLCNMYFSIRYQLTPGNKPLFWVARQIFIALILILLGMALSDFGGAR